MSSSTSLQCSRSAALHTSSRGRTTHISLSIMSISSRLMDLNLRLIFVLCLMLVLHPARINVRSLPLHHSKDSTSPQHHDNEHSHLTQPLKDDSASNILNNAPHNNRETKESGQRSKRAIARGPSYMPNARYWEDGIIPFVFEGRLRDERIIQNKILNAMDTWHRKTCIRFVPKKPSDEFFVKILYSTQLLCEAKVGFLSTYRNRGQPMLLSKYCAERKGRLLHELGHVIGFLHEQQRPDRDQYIRVNMSNVRPGLIKEFRIINNSISLGVPYDFKSIMHYDVRSTSINESRPSFTVLDERVDISQIGQRNVLSRLDKLQANLLYNCSTRDYIKEIILRRGEVIKTSNFIEHGDQLSIQPLLNNTKCQWLSCSFQGCNLSSCPGKIIRPNDRQRCPQVLHRIHKISNESSHIAVGDYVSLHKDRTLETFGCTERPGNCYFSTSHCISDSGDFNSRECCEQILVVRSMGKQEGERIQHKDEIWFEFLKTPSLLPGEMSWLACDSGSSSNGSCYRVIEKVNLNEVDGGSGGGGSSGAYLFNIPPTLFSIYKF